MSDIISAHDMKREYSAIGNSDQYWNTLRHFGTGPKYAKLNRKVVYRRADVEAWIEANLHTRTDRPVNA